MSSIRQPASRRHVTVTLVYAAQYAATGLGVLWGFASTYGQHWLADTWGLVGLLACLLLGIDWLRFARFVPRPPGGTAALILCAALGISALVLMSTEAFIVCCDPESFVLGILLLLPFLLSMNWLARVDAWLGVAGAAVLFATSVAMLIHNALSAGRGGCGFFARWVY